MILIDSELTDHIDHKYMWLCKNKHKCLATLHQVRDGFQCKKCKNLISEEKVRFVFEQLTGEKFIKTRKVLDGRLELDGYCDKLHIAFEHNGSQHYFNHPLWHKNPGNSLQLQQERDYRKTVLCQLKNILKLDVKFQTVKNVDILINCIKNFLLRHNIAIKCEIIEWSRFDYLPDNYKNLKLHAEKRQGRLLTPCFLGSHCKHEFKCNICDHTWGATAKDVISKNSWCPKCANNQYKNISYVSQMADKVGLSLRSSEYVGMNKKYEFVCKKCHNVIITSANSIQQNKKMCSVCSGNKAIDIDEFEGYIRRRGIELLSYFSGLSKSHLFECLLCHNRWKTKASNIWHGRGCPKCAINSKKLSMQDLHKMAKSRNLLLLSEKCLGIHTLHKWQCVECKKILHIKPSNVRRGTSCRKCKKTCL